MSDAINLLHRSFMYVFHFGLIPGNRSFMSLFLLSKKLYFNEDNLTDKHRISLVSQYSSL